MKKIAIFFSNGFEETEALVPLDMFVRTKEIEVIRVLVDDIDDMPERIADDYFQVVGSHNVALSFKLDDNTVLLSKAFDKISKADGLFFPGGLRCAKNLGSSEGVSHLVKDFYSRGKLLSAICASPASVLAKNGAINPSNKGVCYPGCEALSGINGVSDFLSEAFADESGVCISGNVISGRGAGVAFAFAFAVIEYLCSQQTAQRVKSEVLYI